jgi:hypothetical protein
MPQIDCSLHCTKIWGPALREAPCGVIFKHHGKGKSGVARGKTKTACIETITIPWFF